MPSISTTCIACRRQHVKCDAQIPSCGRCRKLATDCLYVPSRRGFRASARTKTSQQDTGQYNYPGNSPLPPEANEINTCIDFQLTSTDSTATALNLGLCQHEDNRMDDEELIDVFYKSFFPAHPFVIPRKMHKQRPDLLPHYLKAVMCFIASHYHATAARDSLQCTAIASLRGAIQTDGFKVQGLLLLAMCMYARFEQNLGASLLDEAIALALQLGMCRGDFAAANDQGMSTLRESWRRTWWELFIVDGLLSAIDSSSYSYSSRLRSVVSQVALPGHCEDYIDCRINADCKDLFDMQNRAFLESDYSWSSFAYKIEAMRILRTVMQLGPDTLAVSQSKVESIDASISDFLFSLPPEKQVVLVQDYTVDEMLFGAHMIINWACITLHKPRSGLMLVRNLSTACTKEESYNIPVRPLSCHSAKALLAAHAISNLTSLRSPLTIHTPCFACAIVLAATVHFPACTLQENVQEAEAIRQRIQLSVTALSSIGTVWPLARVVKSQLAQFAREIFLTPALSTIASSQAQAPLQLTDLDTILLDEPWLVDLCQSNLVEGEVRNS